MADLSSGFGDYGNIGSSDVSQTPPDPNALPTDPNTGLPTYLTGTPDPNSTAVSGSPGWYTSSDGTMYNPSLGLGLDPNGNVVAVNGDGTPVDANGNPIFSATGTAAAPGDTTGGTGGDTTTHLNFGFPSGPGGTSTGPTLGQSGATTSTAATPGKPNANQLKKIASLGGLGALAGLGAAGLFNSKPVPPFTPPPVFGSAFQQAFGSWLRGGIGKGATPYGQPLSPNLASTMLPGLWSSYQGMTPGAIQGSNAATFNNQIAPLTGQIMGQGGPSGPGTFGLQNMLTTGVASPGAGRSLLNWGNITPQMAASFLLPFAAGQNPAAYKPPTIGGF